VLLRGDGYFGDIEPWIASRTSWFCCDAYLSDRVGSGNEPRSAKGIFGFDREADVKSIYLIYRCISLERPPELRAASSAIALHYVYGASLGALYALTKPRVRWIARSSGVIPGALLWIGADELPISLTGISDPFRRSIASHASALVAHVVFAVTVDQMIRGSADTQCIESGEAYG
jgi:hypothetical protein